MAIMEAEKGQIIARRIAFYLRHIDENTSKPDENKETIQKLQKLSTSQIQHVKNVQTGFKGILAGLIGVRSPPFAEI